MPLRPCILSPPGSVAEAPDPLREDRGDAPRAAVAAAAILTAALHAITALRRGRDMALPASILNPLYYV